MDLRSYQYDVAHRCFEAWDAGRQNVCLVMPTGAGKTHTKTWMTKQLGKRTMCIAHRQELVLQISESLAMFGIYHRVVAPDVVVRFCASRHIKLFGASYVDSQANFCVAGVQTLVRRADQYEKLFRHMQVWDIDECHHVLPDNQWGRAVQMFPNAIGLGVTATPLRCDRKPLDATFDSLIVGPTMRDLIDQGHLSEYRVFCPPQSIRREDIRVSPSTGEFQQQSLRDVIHGSHIVGDVVAQYLRIAAGKRGLTFCVDVETATLTAEAYRIAGVPAQLVTGKTPDAERAQYLDQLASGELLQLVNVDLFGEGMDCPALEVVSMARPTQSYGLYCQQFGRALRTLEGKSHAIIIDHVGNVIEHGLPDAPRQWSLAGSVRSVESDGDAIPLRACSTCMQVYQRHHTACPWCGSVPVPAGRSAPEMVDGDLMELDPAVLARMRGQVIPLDSQPAIPHGATRAIIGRRERDHGELIAEQIRLRQSIAHLAGVWKHGSGLSDREIHKRFFLTFNTTVLDAMALRRADAQVLANRIEGVLT